MPFEDLVQVIETLRERIEAHRQSLQSNETRTRMALIDPLLRALGWDTENPALVLPEYELDTSRDTTRRADYALLGVESKPAAVIEAKRLGAPLANYLDQMLTYASRAGIRYAGVTDGNHWEIYAVFDPKPLDERRLLHVSIANDAPHECALNLLLLWHPNLASGQPLQPSAPVLAEPADREPPPPAPKPLPQPVASPPSGGWVPLTELDTPAHVQPPLSIRFTDGQEASITSWKSLLQETAMWLDSKGLLSRGSSIPSGAYRHVLHHNPVHPSGNNFTEPLWLPKSETYLDLGVNTSAPGRLRSVLKLLEGCGRDPAKVSVRPRT